ncbi:MAG: response regulator [Gemmatimonadaceae bacterium]|nr:response regulator [Gemmatimonadaceae bacterium]
MDDEPHIGLILRTRLEQGPFRVLLASDGSGAFAQLAAHPQMALIILDLMLPGMSGQEILTVLRSDARWREVPCLILTAAGQDAQLRAVEALGVSGVMTKPFSPRRLYERVVTLTLAETSSLQETAPAALVDMSSLSS